MVNRRKIGKKYEAAAASYLIQKSYEIIEQNYYGRHGEIDVIASKNGMVIFVEVKYRTDLKKGYPQESVNPVKQRRIYQTAREYLYRSGYRDDQPCRFDVISILGTEMIHIKDAFS